MVLVDNCFFVRWGNLIVQRRLPVSGCMCRVELGQQEDTVEGRVRTRVNRREIGSEVSD